MSPLTFDSEAQTRLQTVVTSGQSAAHALNSGLGYLGVFCCIPVCFFGTVHI